MAHFVLLWLLLSPLVLALAWVLLAGRGLQRVKYLGAAALTAFSGLLALLAANRPAGPLCLFSHPSAGAMCVLPEPSALRLCALLCLLLAALIAARSNTLTISPLQAAFLFASLSAGCLALVSEHFLLRYIALELAAIWFLIELFLAFQGEDAQMRRSISAFINLRVGDAGLLIAIFLMYSASGNFNIARSLEAAPQLNANNLALTAAGLLLATWVKMGAWPLNWWARTGERLHASLFTWFCRLLIPVLGGYLLYRSTVLIPAVSGLGGLLLLGASACALGSALIRIFQNSYRDTILANQSYTACLLLCLAGAGAGAQILPALASFLLARLVIDLLRHTEQRFIAQQCSQRTQWLLWARMLELLLFVPLVIHAAQSAPQGIWTFLLWSGFGLHFLLTAGKIDLYFLTQEGGGWAFRPEARAAGLVILSGGGAWILHHSTRLWMLGGHRIWQPQHVSQVAPLLPLMLAGMLSAGMILLGIKLAQKSPALAVFTGQTAGIINGLIAKKTAQGKVQDVFDQTPYLMRTYQRLMDFLYDRKDIFDQYPRLIRGYEKMIRFLYETVEHFTSVEIWRNLQNTLFALARRLQQLHTGKLRLNLVWVVLLLVLLVVLYLSGRLDVINSYG